MKNAGKSWNLGPKEEDLALFGALWIGDVPFFSGGLSE